MPALKCVACGVTFINGLAYLDQRHQCVVSQSKASHPSNPRPAS